MSAAGAFQRTHHQAAIDAIRASIATRGYPPTIRELGDAIGLTPGTVQPMLRHLEILGRIRRVPNSPRAIEIVDDLAAVTDEQRHAALARGLETIGEHRAAGDARRLGLALALHGWRLQPLPERT